MKYASSFAAWHPRLLLGLGVLLAMFLGWSATDRAAQDPEPNKQPPKQRREEEEDTPPPKVVPRARSTTTKTLSQYRRGPVPTRPATFGN